MTLAYGGHRWLHREVDLKHKPAALLAASAKGTVPVLITADRTVVDESIEIMDWALLLQDPDDWRGAYAHSPDALHRCVNELESRFKPALDKYKYGDRGDAELWRSARAGCATFLDELESLQQESGCLNGLQPGYADVALMPFVRQCANVDLAWFGDQAWPHLQRWLRELIEHPLFIGVMTKHPRWQPEQPALVLPQR